jgi:hypothetical protein
VKEGVVRLAIFIAAWLMTGAAFTLGYGLGFRVAIRRLLEAAEDTGQPAALPARRST